MTVSLEELRAWVDGELDVEHADRVEAAVSNSEELQELTAALQASQLPYREAYDALVSPKVPNDLNRRHGEDTVSAEVAAKKSTVMPMALVASGLLVAAVAGYFIGIGKLSDAETNQFAAVNSSGLSESSGKPDQFATGDFAKAVASYQALYVRNTVASTRDNNLSLLSKRLLEKNNINVQVPDFEKYGYKFIRSQELAFNGTPLVQLIYLADNGLPLALCFMVKTDAAAQDNDKIEPLTGTYFGLQTAEWLHAENRFVIVSDRDEAHLRELYRAAIDQWKS